MSSELPPRPLSRARIATFYFLFFTVVGGFMPYWTLYLQGLGLSAATIGVLVALTMVMRIVAPNLWAALSDARGTRIGVIRLGAFAALAAFALVPFAETAVWVGLVIALFSAFWTAVLPQFEALTLTTLAGERALYSRLRLWGSVGFVVASTLVGIALERLGILSLPWMVLALIAGVALMSGFLHEPAPPAARGARVRLAATLLRPGVIALLVACAFMQASHGPYYVFFSIYLEDNGFSRGSIGALWSLGVVAEVVLFALLPPVLARYRLEHVFAWCFALTAIRWLMLASLPAATSVLIVVQLLHAVSFGAYHAVAIQIVHGTFPGALQARGQALYSSLSFGAGGALGSVASGWLWSEAGPASTFAVAALTALVGGAVVWFGLDGGRVPNRHPG